MLKIKGSENCSKEITFSNEVYKSDKNGVFLVSDEAGEEFVKFHNFTYYNEFEDNKKNIKSKTLDIDELI